MLKPINDVMKIEIASDKFGYGEGGEKSGTETGIVVELPSELPYFGFHSFSFEGSYDNPDNKTMLEFYSKLVGKRVYWKSYSERGMTLKEDDKTYAFIKFTDLIAYSDDVDNAATTVEVQDGGAFNIEKE